ncbi:MAG TPA: MATE family efflux transporter [Clostridiaceae bacterium]|nr:MATE family efflux transporter [Clostridiaceae bacterium]HHV99078.1 MATE family efflux transporter [Clostridiaceae bacterium]
MIVKNDFSKGSVVKNIMNMAIPMILAQLVNVLYSVVDRIYIGKIPENSFQALTGIGVCLPIISMVTAFANLFGMGGAPLCSIERGRGNNEEAENIMGNSFIMLVTSGVLLTILGLIIRKPMLYLFGASDATFVFANQYITIYLLGNVFVMISLGMNQFINAQGFGRIAMSTVVLGAAANIILDPIFIFIFNMGVRGAALATIISQFLSSLWVVKFLISKEAILKLNKNSFILKKDRAIRIIMLGTSGFAMQFTNSLVQILCNSTLQVFGGDLYVGIMTVINSIREILSLPVSGLSNGAQPVIGFNYGARKYKRVISSIKFITIASVTFNTVMWVLLQSFPGFFIRVFNSDPDVLRAGIPVTRIFYSCFFIMALQYAGQTTFIALGKSKNAVFFSMFRKVILVIPLVILLPRFLGLGSNGVFLSEPISEFIGGIACYTTMIMTVRKELKEENQQDK